MTKLEALPFDPERWPALQAEGYTMGVFRERHEVRFWGITSDGSVGVEYKSGKGQWVDPSLCWMLPPPVVIEFKVGLFHMGVDKYGIAVLAGIEGWREDSGNFIRLLTPEERAKGEVRVEG